jgi:aminoglycoside 6'-N-acetyltransferase I
VAGVVVRSIRRGEAEQWAALRGRLWPAADGDDLTREALSFLEGRNVPAISAAFIAEDENVPLGFLELAIRPFSDGCDSMPVPHVEGWYVEGFARGRGVGRALMEAAENWARERGFVELASDTEIHNEPSLAAHARCGFHETERLVKFRKMLR